MTGPRVVTMGCRLNAFESEVIRDHAVAAGLDDTVILNTCAVTAEAERQARQTIRRLKRENPSARIVVTGCAAQIDPAAYGAMPEVSTVLGNEEKMRPESYLPRTGDEREDMRVTDIMEVREVAGHLIDGFDSRTRAFVQIQQGCDHRCTFCIIPFGRGNSRSVAVGAVVEQVRRLTTAGVREVVLTGVDISSYGGDLPGQPTLGDLVRRLLRLVPDLPRLRLSSLDPAVRDPALLETFAEEPRLMPHLHLSAQAGSDMVLKRMKRRHSRARFIELCDELRQARADVVFGADLITGFPTETDEMFADTLDLVAEAGLTFLHVFPYSERPGTPAARMPSAPKRVRRERARALREAGEEAKSGYLRSLVGAPAEILVEQQGRGYTAHYAPARFDRTVDAAVQPGSLVYARIEGVADGELLATAA